MMAGMFHIGSSDECVENTGRIQVGAATSRRDFASEVVARRKKTAVLLALTGQMLADVRELLAQANEEVARQRRRASRLKMGRRPMIEMKSPPIRKTGRRRR
jgi:hypothetical protein